MDISSGHYAPATDGGLQFVIIGVGAKVYKHLAD